MVYCDTPFQNEDSTDVHPTFRGRRSLHLMADTTEELVEYGAKIGLRDSWLQHKGRKTEHFDVVGIKLKKVLEDDRVVKLNRREFVKKYNTRDKL